jgi:hypothetical protein
VWPKSTESGGAETYQDIFVGNTLWPDHVALKVLAYRGLLLELHRLADKFEHFLSIERVIQILWVNQQHILGVCGAEGDGASGLRVHKNGERRCVGAFFGGGIAAGRYEEGAIGYFVNLGPSVSRSIPAYLGPGL